MSQDLFKLSTGFNCVPQGDERIALRLYYKHAATLLREFDRWKEIERFYFIPIKLNMAFFCPGGATAIAFPPYFIGTILRNSIEHPDLFGTKCKCGHQAYGYSYNGSPWSGRVDMSLACPGCGAQMDTTESGWRIRSEALKASQAEDLKRGRRMQFLHPSFESATIQELLRYLNVPEEDLVLPPEKHKITRHKLGNGRVLVHDSAGGFVIVEE